MKSLCVLEEKPSAICDKYGVWKAAACQSGGDMANEQHGRRGNLVVLYVFDVTGRIAKD